MGSIDRATVLRKTHWGVDIYAHILRQSYPGETVIRITGRDCGICRNPFAAGARTLHIWYQRNNPEGQLSEETAYHKDQYGAIPDGDALDFAALYYKQTGQELLDTLNREMHLNLEGIGQYDTAPFARIDKGPRFSFFKAQITNTRPHKSITLLDAYNYIVGPFAKEQTLKLRSIEDKKKAKLYKAANFNYATFCGEFSIRSNDKLVTDSHLICLDFDHIDDVEALFASLIKDEYLDTVLLFRSPSGDGLKWVIEIPDSTTPRQLFFQAVVSYISRIYGQKIDQSGKDISRACFLPYDPYAFINKNYM